MQAATLTRSELLIGTAVPATTFILLEVPLPWDKPALLSSGVPESLRQVIRSQLVSNSNIRVHLIANEESSQRKQRRILIFQRGDKHQSEPLNNLVGDYDFWEIQVEAPAEMATGLEDFLKRKRQPTKLSSQRHLMVCTHASHNECCGIHGYPFYRDAIATVQQLGLDEQINLWQISHIGGHRFAPTLIDFPHGRYYGNLDRSSLLCLLKQTGNLESLLSTYRGWSLLPKALQPLEAELWQQVSWPWLRSRVCGQVLTQTTAGVWAELLVKLPRQPLVRYTAKIQNNRLHSYQAAPVERPYIDTLEPSLS